MEWTVPHLKVHVLSQQLFVQVLVFQGSVSMANPLSSQHFYGLKYPKAGHEMGSKRLWQHKKKRKGIEKNRRPPCGSSQQNVLRAIYRRLRASCGEATLSLGSADASSGTKPSVVKLGCFVFGKRQRENVVTWTLSSGTSVFPLWVVLPPFTTEHLK